MACVRPAGVNVAIPHGEPAKDGLDFVDRFSLPTDHEAGAGERAVRPARGSYINEMQSLLLHAGMTPDGVAPIGVATIGNNVPGFERPAQFVQQLIDKRT